MAVHVRDRCGRIVPGSRLVDVDPGAEATIGDERSLVSVGDRRPRQRCGGHDGHQSNEHKTAQDTAEKAGSAKARRHVSVLPFG